MGNRESVVPIPEHLGGGRQPEPALRCFSPDSRLPDCYRVQGEFSGNNPYRT